ncbi:MAG: tetratricopeptide repeat protein [Nitrospinota bacterium]
MGSITEAELRDWRKSREFNENLVELLYTKARSSKSPYMLVPLADAYANLGETDSAISLLKASLVEASNNRAALTLLAQLYYKKGEQHKAYKLLLKVVNQWPGALAASYLLCKLLANKSEWKRAFLISSDLVPYYPDNRFVKAMVQFYKKSYMKHTAKPKPTIAIKQSTARTKDKKNQSVDKLKGRDSLAGRMINQTDRGKAKIRIKPRIATTASAREDLKAKMRPTQPMLKDSFNARPIEDKDQLPLPIEKLNNSVNSEIKQLKLVDHSSKSVKKGGTDILERGLLVKNGESENKLEENCFNEKLTILLKKNDNAESDSLKLEDTSQSINGGNMDEDLLKVTSRNPDKLSDSIPHDANYLVKDEASNNIKSLLEFVRGLKDLNLKKERSD